MKYTFAQIVKANRENGFFFFSPDTMNFFGDRLASFGVKNHAGHTYLFRKPSATIPIFGEKQKAGIEYANVWEFKPDNGDLVPVRGDLEQIIHALVFQKGS